MNRYLNKMHHSWLMLLFCPALASADPMFYHFYAGATLGASQGKLGNSSSTIRYSTITDMYPTTSSSSTSASGGLNGGVEFFDENMNFSIAAGLGLYTAQNYKYNGNLVEMADDDPSTRTSLYNYRYKVGSTRIMVEGQLNWLIENFAPFINVGVGGAWNTASNYSELPDVISYPPLPPFSSNTTSSIAYQAGVGLSYLFNTTKGYSYFKSERLSLAYRYTSLGKVQFGNRGSAYPYSLDTGNFKTNEVYLQYVHYF